MRKLVRFLLISNRKYRCLSVLIILWTLRILFEVENDRMRHHSDILDSFDSGDEYIPKHKYNAVEEDYTSSEHALGFLECAIDDLYYSY